LAGRPAPSAAEPRRTEARARSNLGLPRPIPVQVQFFKQGLG
jgi:hypothetical protein